MATVSDTFENAGPLGPALQRRHRRDRGMTLFLTALMIGIGGLLVWILAYVAKQGVQALDWGFLTDTPPGNPSDAGGGFYNGIIGSLEIVGLATVIALLLAFAFGVGGLERSAGIIQASTPAAVFAAIIALEHDLLPDFVTATVLFSTAVSVITMAVVLYLL